uniref:AlNc14C334G10714 protein n=1 Tax=Albugo laibachii Nc14 TaxID=890382 RepID=F0WWV3_9STRA|nr:AlNc14C334G10714 [Albugo laibachii Nc14]|eukprot:CCA25938.1 AlNc14C334G10714 [Albugo laibachii Nc14]
MVKLVAIHARKELNENSALILGDLTIQKSQLRKSTVQLPSINIMQGFLSIEA